MQPLVTGSMLAQLIMWMLIPTVMILIITLFLSGIKNSLCFIAKGICNLIMPPKQAKAEVKIKINQGKSIKNTLVDNNLSWHNPKACLKQIDRMSGRQFEQFLDLLFQKLGYETELGPGMKDHGADIVITDAQGRKLAIQAKKLQDNRNRIGAAVLGEVYRGMNWYGCIGGIVVTNQYFTEQMDEEAKRFNISLWDRVILAQKITRAHNLQK